MGYGGKYYIPPGARAKRRIAGIHWLLLFLWQALFHLLGIDYRELFEEPVFIYPVTSLTFGCAMHLIGSIDRLRASLVATAAQRRARWCPRG